MSAAFLSPLCVPISTPSLAVVRVPIRSRYNLPRATFITPCARLSPPDDKAPQSPPDQLDAPNTASAYVKSDYTPQNAVGSGGNGPVDGNGASRGGGDGADNSGNSDDEAHNLQSALKSSGRTLDDLSEYARGLPSPNLLSYITATSSPFSAFLANNWQGWARRCAGDPEFPFKVLMELTVGLGLSSSGMIAARGKDILKELDFAICDIAVGAAVNFVLVYLLTPALLPASVKPSVFAKLPANMFIAGNYSLGSRLATLGYKAALFSVCGFAASVFGTTLSQSLIAIRGAIAPGSKSDKKLPNLVSNSLGWAAFMAFSANPRYQLVAGVERGLFAFAPDAVAKGGSALLRTGNNVVGGANWVWFSRFLGLSPKSEKSEDPPTIDTEPKLL